MVSKYNIVQYIDFDTGTNEIAVFNDVSRETFNFF